LKANKMNSEQPRVSAPSWEHPHTLWMNGRLVPWDECAVHVTSGYAQRGASVFEGIRVYRTVRPSTFLALALEEHLARLSNTWRALSLPMSYSNEAVREGLTELLSTRELDYGYCRVTRYLGSRTIDNPREPDGVFVALYNSPPLFGKPVNCITSAWRRNELALPSQMKIGGHYFLLSWLRQQAQQLGADDAILVNERNFVSEATGTAVFMCVDGELLTPPVADGALPSITASVVQRLAHKLAIPASIRSIHRSELFRASAVFLAGSLDELRPVTSIDGVSIPPALDCKPVSAVFQAFSGICRGQGDAEWETYLTPRS
jgi:branched-chain amino acid aminotransferase